MLASTVKFSRCGRQTGRRFLAPVTDSAGRSVAYATEPSGPNSVLGLLNRLVEVPLLTKQEVLTTKSAKEAYWSMFHIPVPTRFQSNVGKPSAGQICDLPNGSLERR